MPETMAPPTADRPATSAPAPATSAPTPAATEEALKPLWRNWRFQALWLGSGASLLGINAADFAYPLVILAMTGSPALAAIFGFIQIGATTLSGLPAGALVDRWDRRRVLIGAELVRAITVGTVAVAAALGHLTLPHLYAVAAVIGAATQFGGPARMLMIRAVVPTSQLTAALTQDEVRTAAAGLAGPPLGGVLLTIGRAIPFLAGAITFTVSLLAALVVRVPARTASPVPAKEPTADGGMLRGLRVLWGHRTMRSALAMISLINVGGAALFLAVVVLLQAQGASPRAIGVAAAGEAVGTLLGAGLVGWLHRRVAPGWLLLGVAGSFAALLPLLAVPLGPWWVFGVLTAAMLGVPALRVLIDVLILRQVPDAERGRTISALMMVLTVGIPFGTLAGGFALEWWGPTATILGVCVLTVAALAMGAADRQLRAARWPTTG